MKKLNFHAIFNLVLCILNLIFMFLNLNSGSVNFALLNSFVSGWCLAFAFALIFDRK